MRFRAAPDAAHLPRDRVRGAARTAARPIVAATIVTLLLPLALACDGGLKPEPAFANCPSGICGTVHFRGVVPESTQWVRVVVYANIPTSVTQLTSFAGFSDVLPLGADSAFYSCCLTSLPPGTYRWVLIVWQKVGALSQVTAPDLLREVGAYQDPADTTQFGTVVVQSGGGVGGVDMVADYGKMRSISDFFPAAPDMARSRHRFGSRAVRNAARPAVAAPAPVTRAPRPPGGGR